MGEHKNWFARNKGFVFGFAVAVAILNIVIFVLMPAADTHPHRRDRNGIRLRG